MHLLFRQSGLRSGSLTVPLRNAAVLAAFAVAAISGAPAAHAQFSSLGLPSLDVVSGAPGTADATLSMRAGKSSVFSLGFYPFAPFQFNANVKQFTFNAVNNETGQSASVTIPSQSASFTANGVLFAPEYVYALKSQHSGIGIGGWYWLHTQNKSESYTDKFNADLYDIHLKYFATPKLGVEVGYLGQTNGSIPKQQGPNAYVSYVIAASNAIKKGSYGITAGLGIQDVQKTTLNIAEQEDSGTVFESFEFKQTTDFGAYVSGAYYVIPHGSINLSYWLLTGSQSIDASAGESADGVTVSGSGSTSQSRTVSRFALGFGYQF